MFRHADVVSCVHPVAVLNAAFCMTCSLLMLVEDAIGDHTEEAYSGSNDLSLHVVELSGNNRCQQIEINTYPDSPLFISTGFLPRVSSKRLN